MALERNPPISDQVRRLLWQRIQEGAYSPENRLPSEEHLARELAVSRATVRTALAALAADGLLSRRQGDGTYVNTGLIEVQTRIDTMWEFTRLIEASGRQPAITPLAVEHRAPTSAEARGLRIPLEEPVVSLVRLFLADQQPVVYSINTVRQALMCREPSETDLHLPIFELLEQYCQQVIAYAIADLSAILPDELVGQQLRVPPNTPLIRFEEVFYDRNNHPLVFAMNFYNDKLLRLKIARSKS